MSISKTWTIPTLAALPLLCGALLLPACELKDGEDTGASSEGSTTGDDTSSGGSGSASASSTSNSSGGTGTDTAGTSGGTGNSTGSSTTTGDATGDVSTDTGDMTTTVGTSMTSGDPTGDPTGDTTTGDPPPACEGDPKALDLVTSMAYLKSQIPPDMTTSGGSSGSSTGGDEPDPATMYIKLSSQIFTCKDPNAIVDCGPEWEITIVIPPEFQTIGAIYDLEGQDVFATFIETGADEGGNMCSFGGGSGGGTFQILDIDQNQVTGRLCNVPTWFFTETMPDLEGTFVADRC